MIPLLALAVLQGEGIKTKVNYLDGIRGRKSIMLQTPTERLRNPKISPKFAWEFDWTTAGYTAVRPNGKEQASLCFELYSQESTQGSPRPENVVRTLMRLYEYNVERLNLEHSPEFGNGLVSVYLCYGGEPGGEQLYDVDRQNGFQTKVNTIYLYDLRSFTDPVEAVREVAHEYGHATLPPVGGFVAPENWSNGYLGEKLYLTYLRDALVKGTPDKAGLSTVKLTPADAMGGTAKGLDAWVAKNVDPLVAEAATHGPRPALLGGTGKASMDAFLGLALWTAQVYDEKVMTRALFTNGMEDAKGFPEASSTAAEEPKLKILNIPPALRSKPFWIPIGKDKKKSVLRGATELTDRKSGWVRIQPNSATTPITVRNYID